MIGGIVCGGAYDCMIGRIVCVGAYDCMIGGIVCVGAYRSCKVKRRMQVSVTVSDKGCAREEAQHASAMRAFWEGLQALLCHQASIDPRPLQVPTNSDENVEFLERR